MCNKISFLAVTPNLSILGHMLLRKLYINVVIAKILLYLKSWYGVPEPKYLEFSQFYAAMTKKSVFGNIFKTNHFRSYVASYVVYKYGHCEHFAV